jgi:2-phospho-L-lactate guanylyltransferase
VSSFGPQAVLIPVKAFGEAKLRLAPALSPPRRAALAREMATRVVSSAAGLPVAVVCDDREVAAWARGLNALVVWEPGRGLNGAVQEGVHHLGVLGARSVIVAAGDLPLAKDLTSVGGFPGVTLVPDRHHNGTNVIAVPTASGFTFSYGPGSFARHMEEAWRIGAALRVIQSPPLAWDVDVPSDLTAVSF